MLTITAVLDCGDDVLLVQGDVSGVVYEARGWTSATTNHYDPADVGADGFPVKGATTRAMTPAEVGEYATQLLLAQNPELAARAQPSSGPSATPLSFVAAPVQLAPPVVA